MGSINQRFIFMIICHCNAKHSFNYNNINSNKFIPIVGRLDKWLNECAFIKFALFL